jgi:hypothetical protein
MSGYRTTRRGALALAGSAALAGCGGLFDRPPATVDGTKLQSLSPAVPTVSAALPVALPDSFYADAHERVTTLLESVPSSFSDEQIPNEAIRAEVASTRDRAREELDAAATAEGPVSRLDNLRRARGSAANAAAAWQSIDGDLDRAAVRDRLDSIRADLSTFRETWTYVGDEPVPAAVIHWRLENLAHEIDRGITDGVERHSNRAENAVTIGLLAGELERARAGLDEATVIYETFAESVTGELEATFDSAAQTLVADLEDRLAALPEGDVDEASSFVDADVSGTPTAEAIERLSWQIDDVDWVREAIEVDRPASAVVRAYRDLVTRTAFDRLVERAEAGEAVRVTEATEVLSLRESAIEAITEAATNTAWPPLARSHLHVFVHYLHDADAELRRNGEDAVEVDWLMDELREYVTVAAAARSVPAATASVAAALGDDE